MNQIKYLNYLKDGTELFNRDNFQHLYDLKSAGKWEWKKDEKPYTQAAWRAGVYLILATFQLGKPIPSTDITLAKVIGVEANVVAENGYCCKQDAEIEDEKGDVYGVEHKTSKYALNKQGLEAFLYHDGQISGQLKAILDRCRAVVAKNPKVFENKVGAGIAVGGDRNGGQDPTLQTMIDFYIINEMIPVGGGSFGANLGAAIWSKDKLAKGAEADEEGLRTIRRTVDRLLKVASLIHG